MLRAFFPPPRPVRKKVTRRKPAANRRPVRGIAVRTPDHAGTSRSGSGRWLSARYSGPAGVRPYFLYVPGDLDSAAAVPLLVALHGCDQDAAEFAATTRFNLLADRGKFVVAYPQQRKSDNAHRCWNWFRPNHQERGLGEPAILAGIVGQVMEHTAGWTIDASRVYVLGLSAGGAMAAVLAATYPELFAAVGVHSAPPYRAASTVLNASRAMAGLTGPPSAPRPGSTSMPPLVIFHGTRDHVVSSVNAERLAVQWLAHNSVRPDQPRSTQIGDSRTYVGSASGSAGGRRAFKVERWYGPRGRKMLEMWTVEGLGHAWSGGTPHGSYSDPRGPRASTEMWRFLAGHHT
jgi:poly(hydroxyalkanoate) depolymerase family esterase